MKILTKKISSFGLILSIFVLSFSSTITHVFAATGPIVIAPTASTSYNILSFNYTIPVTPTAGSVKIVFSPQPSGTNKTITMNNNLTNTFTYNPSTNPVISIPSAASADFTSLADGLYNVTVQYIDLSSSAGSTIVNSVRVKTSTGAPTVTSPVTSSTYNSPTVPVSFNFPDTLLSGSAILTFINTTTSTVYVVTLNNLANNTTHTFNLNRTNLSSNSQVASSTPGNSIPDGPYTIVFSYQDYLSNPASSVTATNVTLAPTATTTPVPTTTAVVTTTPIITTTTPKVNSLSDTGQNFVVQEIFGIILFVGVISLVMRKGKRG